MSLAFSHSGAAGASAQAKSRARWPALVAIVVVAACVQALGGLDLDVAWFMTFAERTLQGARAYVDVSDPNPPAAVLIYLPAMALSQWTGLKAEALVVAQTLALAAGAVLFAARLETVSSRRFQVGLAGLFALTIAPAAFFAEREHYAAMAALVAASAVVALGRGLTLEPRGRFMAGCAVGAASAFKPHFALAFVAPFIYATISRGTLRWLGWREIAGCASVLASYAALALIFYPDYFTLALPDALEVYAALREPLSAAFMSATTWFMLAIVAAALAAARFGALSAASTGAALASLGFVFAYFAQFRFQLNHASPAIELAAMPLLEFAMRGEASRLAPRALAIALVVLAPLFLRVQALIGQSMGAPAVVAAARDLTPPGGRVGAIADSMELTFPAARHIGGTWVNRYNSLWRANTARALLEHARPEALKAERLRAVIASDRRQLAEDFATGKPDVIIIESAEIRLREIESPEIAAALAGYRLAKDVDGVELWARRSPGATR